MNVRQNSSAKWEELTLAVNTDPLTKIRNRRYLIEYLENQLSQDEKKKHCAALIDLDLFKSVNDIYPDKRLYKAKAAGRNKIKID